jgi:hypothetical protein
VRLRAVAPRVAALLALAAALPSPAAGIVRPAVTIDGPSSDILSLGGVAMAPDGTGGLVYLKRDQGEPHVFVSRFVGGQWQAPQRLDTALPFDSRWPQIGAGDGGRLVVVWAQSFAKDPNNVPLRRLYSATVKPGSTGFGSQIAFDSNLHNSNATGDAAVSQLYPALSMNAAGQAYVVYRVVTNSCASNSCGISSQGTFYRPGDAFADFRLARFNGETWSVLGSINRNTAFSVRPGTANNSPQVTIDAAGHGVVSFQEPDGTGFDRIWARRLFGTAIGHILLASPQALAFLPVNGDADAFSLAGASAGAAVVAYRQQTAPGSVYSAPHVFANSLPSSSKQNAGEFAGALTIDGGAGGLGAPAVAVSEPGSFRAAFAGDNALQLAAGDAVSVGSVQPLDPVTGADRPGVTIGPGGSTVSAWDATDGAGQPLVAVEEDVDNQPARAHVSATVGGAIADLTLVGSGRGDAIVAFRQGQGGDSQIAAAVVDAPPSSFAASAPAKWERPGSAAFSWAPALHPLGPVSYTPVVDGVPTGPAQTATSYRLDPRGLQSGVYSVGVIATDDAGQQTLSLDARLRVDGDPPKATVIRHGRDVIVRVSDGPPGWTSGVDGARTSVRFGDSARTARVHWGRRPQAVAFLRHRYSRSGRFTIRVRARDNAGNAMSVAIPVRVS